MHKIIALGCSLTAQDGYIKYFNIVHRLRIKNYAVSGGSNQLQIHRLNNAFVDNELDKSTVIIWQITSPDRSHVLTSQIQNQEKSKDDGKFNWLPERISLFNQHRYALLSHNPMVKGRCFTDYHENLQSLTIEMIHWSYVVKNIIVYFGWNFLDKGEYEKIKTFLSRRENISLLPREHCICDWVIGRGLPLADDFHPTRQSYIQWGKAVLLAQLLQTVDESADSV